MLSRISRAGNDDLGRFGETHGFRLPTEAEWEYFCRAGTDTSRPFGESTSSCLATPGPGSNSGNQLHPPGQLLPNEFGLFDILGNTWEWCQDGPTGHYVRGSTDFPPYPPGPRKTPRRTT